MKLSIFTVAVPDLDANELASAAAAGIAGVEWRYRGIPEDAMSEQPSYWRNNRCSIDPDRWQAEVPVFGKRLRLMIESLLPLCRI